MCPDPQLSDLINSYSLVSYLPGELGKRLDRLRRDLVRSCIAQSHVTVLPPRPLEADPQTAVVAVQEIVPSFPPFTVKLTGIEIFPVTNVVFAEVGEGREILREMHERLNVGVLHFDEPYEYHPHITLAQNLLPEEVDHAYRLAVEVWRDLPSRSFEVETLVWVRNTLENRWVDLAAFELRGMAPILNR